MIDFGIVYQLLSRYHSNSHVDKAHPGWLKDWDEIRYKVYPRCKKTILEVDDRLCTESLLDLLRKRSSSIKACTSQKMQENDLSHLLYWSVGKHKDSWHRHYPSPGGLYGVECYIVANSVKSLRPGTYHYEPQKHTLEHLHFVSQDSINRFITNLPQADMFILFTARYNLKASKYKEKAYRFLCLETGVMIQNIYLMMTALNLSGTTLGQVNEEDANDMLEIDGVSEFLISTMIINNN